MCPGGHSSAERALEKKSRYVFSRGAEIEPAVSVGALGMERECSGDGLGDAGGSRHFLLIGQEFPAGKNSGIYFRCLSGTIAERTWCGRLRLRLCQPAWCSGTPDSTFPAFRSIPKKDHPCSGGSTWVPTLRREPREPSPPTKSPQDVQNAFLHPQKRPYGNTPFCILPKKRFLSGGN